MARAFGLNRLRESAKARFEAAIDLTRSGNLGTLEKAMPERRL